LFNKLTQAKGTVPTGKGITIGILGDISEEVAIDISLKSAQGASVPETQDKWEALRVVNGRIGTRTEHHRTYLSKVVDVLDRTNGKNLWYA
jgi:hypothetical protein